jgi:hypothetical protein
MKKNKIQINLLLSVSPIQKEPWGIYRPSNKEIPKEI